MYSSDEFDIKSRYDLLCRASRSELEQTHQHLRLIQDLEKLSHIVDYQLPELARQGSPDDFADVLEAMKLELVHFREFCEFPDLAQKVVVGVGGAFSAGKSSLINTILGKKRLVVEVDPTTSLPTYLLKGRREKINALNLFNKKIELSVEEFSSLTHEEKEKYGSQVSGLLKSAFISDPDFPWENIAFLDTPGYSKPEQDESNERTDEHVARAQLNSAQFIVWVVSAAGGVISEDDLKFLGTLNRDIPKLVLVSRSDTKPDSDVRQIVGLIKETLCNRSIKVLDVIPTSARRKNDYPVTPVVAYFDQWNKAPRQLGFAQNFKRLFMGYGRFIDSEQALSHLRLNRLNRILALSDVVEIKKDATELQASAQNDLKRWDAIKESLRVLEKQFFTQLRLIGERVGIPLPEPDELTVIKLDSVDFLGMLQNLRTARGHPLNSVPAVLQGLMLQEVPIHAAKLLRRSDESFKMMLSALEGNVIGSTARNGLLRQKSSKPVLEDLL